MPVPMTFEREFVGKEHEACRRLTIEPVADNGIIQAFACSHVQAQLVSPSRVGPETDKSVATKVIYHFVMCDGTSPVFFVHNLTGTVVGIGADEEVDGALLPNGHRPF